MPYSPPGVVAPSLPTPPAHSHGHPHSPRPGHRRSYTFAPDDPRAGPGAFASLGMLPRRTKSHITSPSSGSSSPNGNGTTTTRKFHFRGDVDGEDSSSSSDEPPLPPASSSLDDDDGPPPPLRLRANPTPAFRLTPASGAYRSSPPRSPQRSPNSSFVNVSSVPAALSPSALHVPVPFPRSSPSPNSPSSPLSPTFASVPSTAAQGSFPVRPPGPARTASTPVILLSNGKPLKSSLKSSSSAPHVPSHHLRARSAPSTPSLVSPAPSAGASPNGVWGDGDSSPGTPKAVHFPAPDAGLEDIRIFKRSARPASVSFPLDEETETETETDSAPRWSSGIASWGSASTHAHGYPFPKVAVGGKSPLNPAAGRAQGGQEKEWRYALNAPGVPRKVDEADMVVLEGMWLVGVGADPSSSKPSCSSPALAAPPTPNTESELTLHGTLLARNVAFEKHVFVRFTLDGWCTTSEVGARYVEGVAHPHCASGQDNAALGDGVMPNEEPGPGWDRFAFSIRLTDYAHSHSRGARSGANTEGLREHGVGGIGRGLEGRELVLVGKFFAPWVRHGGVGPYRWCDTIPQTTPAAQVGTDTSPSGRAWIGQGGGGQGEWWDNNGGKDYRVGFRCVAVAQEPPAPATPTNGIPFPSAEPVAFSLTLPSTPTSTTSSHSSSQPSTHAPLPHAGHAQAHSMASPTGAPIGRQSPMSSAERGQRTQTLMNPIPPPPPPRTAHAQALAAKLGRLSLRNYAAPGGAGRALSLPGSAASSAAAVAAVERTEEESSGEKSEEKKEEDVKLQPAPGTQSTGGVGLYWPWGHGSSAAPATVSVTTATASAPAVAGTTTVGDVRAAIAGSSASSRAGARPAADHDSDSASASTSSSDDEEGSLRDAEAGRARRRANSGVSFAEGEETPPTSPLGAGGLLPVIEGLVGEGDDMTPTNEKREFGMQKKEAEEVPLPVSPDEAEASLESSASSTAAGSPNSISSSETITPGTGSSSPPMKEKEEFITAPSSPLPPSSSSYPFPPTSPSTPPTPSSRSSPPISPSSAGLTQTMPLLPTAADASSSLYKAFVRQWCFAGNGNGNGSANGGSPTKLGSLV